MSRQTRIAIVQDNFLVGDTSGNVDLIIESASIAEQAGADIVVFPELAVTGYPPEDLLHRTEFLEDVDRAIAQLTERLPEIEIIFGAPVLQDGELYNAAVWIGSGKVKARYFKQRLPNYSVFDEVRYFSSGQETVVVEHDGLNFGLSICEDVWDKDTISSIKDHGTEILIVINASPFHIGKYADRVGVLHSRAKENGMPIIYTNMVGGQDELVFDGESLVVDAAGKVLLRSKAFEPSIDYVDVDVGPVLIPVDAGTTEPLSNIESVYRCLVLGVRDFVRKNHFSGVVLGLSGGVDSALTLAIANDALGAENVHAVLMPSRYTADMSNEDAISEAETLGVRYDVIPIETVFNDFQDALSEVFNGAATDTTEENMQARCRGLILMAISNKTGRMLLTTGNKSELAVGYATLYGDMNGGFAPLKDVSKTMVYELCRYRNSIQPIIPERVLTRAPSAELREDQRDQDSLPDYAVLDKILEMSVEQDRSIKEIVESGVDRETVEFVVNLVKRNEYKRHQAAPGVRISKRAFGRDRRYPITSGFKPL